MYKFVGEMKTDTYKKEAPGGHTLMRKDPRYYEEIIDTMQKIVKTMPAWILGGGRSSSMWADDILPRDADPVSRSGLGYLKSGFAEHALILIPLVNDSSRKLAYILKTMGLKVHTFHFPPVKNKDSMKEWNRQYEACRSAAGEVRG